MVAGGTGPQALVWPLDPNGVVRSLGRCFHFARRCPTQGREVSRALRLARFTAISGKGRGRAYSCGLWSSSASGTRRGAIYRSRRCSYKTSPSSCKRQAILGRSVSEIEAHFSEWRGTQMASVPLFLKLCRVPKSKRINLARDLEKWKRLYHWTRNDVDCSKRKGVDRKPGGSPETIATKAVLEVLYSKY